MEWLTNPQAWIALATLTFLEIVLGVDNIIFVTVLVARLEEKVRDKARLIGLGLAMIMRIILLLSISWLMKLTGELFTLMNHTFTGRDLILLLGGLFLIWKSTHEIHQSVEGESEHKSNSTAANLGPVLLQIAVIDMVFSLDSVITAIGLAKEIPVMIIAIVISVFIMMLSAKPIGEFVDKHPTFKILALSFLILVGVTLIGESLGLHIPKGYIYFAMAFSFGVEILNLKIRKKSMAVKLHKKIEP